jgi:hypothetical protein
MNANRKIMSMAQVYLAFLLCCAAVCVSCDRGDKKPKTLRGIELSISRLERIRRDLEASGNAWVLEHKVPAWGRALEVLRNTPPTGLSRPYVVFASVGKGWAGVAVDIWWLDPQYAALETGTVRFGDGTGMWQEVQWQWRADEKAFRKYDPLQQVVLWIEPVDSDEARAKLIEHTDRTVVKLPRKLLAGKLQVMFVAADKTASEPVDVQCEPESRELLLGGPTTRSQN